ncbi:uncharacterized protein (DUF697 family) [Aliiruegeria haliotis]|uniref:Uncharacterized protein (DUF697 family) n=1 Tax=Aliiruegeria haliotis TaxID=1280846 RepID=A0A2T0RJD9_9RHOB|nr:GTPase [Aliiruegeria haliotis]PRY21268.1 uncharacterized protein (DUF697 family) [Aliiruegeria haliotis]
MEFDFSNWKSGSSAGSSKSDEDIWEAVQSVRPVIWLLGKTGAGKTSLISELTGVDTLEIGNGYVSCTKQSVAYDYPINSPLIRFLDTRGLGEVGYDPREEIAQCAGRSHALLVVARKDDPVQGEIAEVLTDILAASPETPVGVVHTGADLIDSEQERQRARLSNQTTFEKAARTDLPSAQTSLGKDPDTSEVLDLLARWLPLVAYSKLREDGRDAESEAFKAVRPTILKFATAAGAVDVAPAVGLIGVPAIQGTMLRSLGKLYGTEWSRKMTLSFAGTLGASTVLRFTASLGVRQAAKLVPGWGQTIGAASAAAISFSTTYALGRAAAYYLFKSVQNEEVTHEELKAVFQTALRGAEHETAQKD